MSQSKRDSLVESLVNTFSGFFFSLFLWHFVIGPLFGYETTAADSLGVTICFTIASILRNYMIRRFFLWRSLR